MVQDIYKLRIFLFKDNIKNLDECFDIDKIKKKQNYKEMKFSSNIEAKGYIWNNSINEDDKPKWFNIIDSFNDHNSDKISVEKNTSHSIFVLKVNQRIFGFNFGQGYWAFNTEKIERDFGLRIFLNVVDKFNNLSSLSINDNVINKKLDTNKSNDINIFAPNKDIDIVKSFVGTVKENYKNLFLEKISANLDSISMNYNIENVEIDLINLCSELIKINSIKDYEKNVNYKWIINKKIETDPVILEKINQKILNDLINQNDNLQLMLFDLSFEKLTTSYFKYALNDGTKHRSLKQFNEINIKDYYSEVLNRDIKINVLQDLKRHVILDENDNIIDNIYNALIAEIEMDNSIYILCQGKIFKISKDYKNEMDNFLESLINESNDIKLPDCKYDEESDYNTKLSNESGYITLDAKNITIRDYDKFEICDVLSDKKEFFCIKHRNSSSTLSHLFNQGLNSVKILKNDKNLREKANNTIKEALNKKSQNININENFSNYEITDNSLKNSTIVFSVIDNKTNKRKLPFFSIISLKQAVDLLHEQGYNAKFCWINNIIGNEK